MKRSRSAILGVTTKLETKRRPYLDKAKEDITSDDLSCLRTIVRQLEKRFEDAGALNSAALERTPDADSDLEKEIEDAEDFENKIGTQLERISSFLEQFEVSDSAVTAAINASPTSSSSTTGNLKMPKFDLPSTQATVAIKLYNFQRWGFGCHIVDEVSKKQFPNFSLNFLL